MVRCGGSGLGRHSRRMQIPLTHVSGVPGQPQCILKTLLGALAVGEGRRGTESNEDRGELSAEASRSQGRGCLEPLKAKFEIIHVKPGCLQNVILLLLRQKEK